jgi:hypothetical protein
MSMGLKGTGRSPVFLQVDGEYTDLPPVKAVELTGVIVGSFEGQKDAAQMTLNNESEKISMYGVDYFVIGSKSWMSGPYTWYAIMKDPITGHWRLYNLEKKNLKICINDEPISAEKDYADLPIGAQITTPSIKESPVLFFKLDEVYAKKMALDKKRKNERDAEVDSMTARHLEESMAILDGLKKNLMNASDTLYTLNGRLETTHDRVKKARASP